MERIKGRIIGEEGKSRKNIEVFKRSIRFSIWSYSWIDRKIRRNQTCYRCSDFALKRKITQKRLQYVTRGKKKGQIR